MIRFAKLADIPRISTIHSEALPEDLLPSLGKNFLNRYFYPLCLAKKEAFLLVYEAKPDLISSFVLFVSTPNAIQSALMKPSRLAQIAIQCLRRPRILSAMLASMLAKRQFSKPVDKLPELFILATDAAFRRQGQASQLLKEGLSQLKQQGYRGCLVKTSSIEAKQFYQQQDFQSIGVEYRGKRAFDILLSEF